MADETTGLLSDEAEEPNAATGLPFVIAMAAVEDELPIQEIARRVSAYGAAARAEGAGAIITAILGVLPPTTDAMDLTTPTGVASAVQRALAAAEARGVARARLTLDAMGGVEPPLALTGEDALGAYASAIREYENLPPDLKRDPRRMGKVHDAERTLRALLARATTTGEGARGTHG